MSICTAPLCARLPVDLSSPGTARRLLTQWLQQRHWQAQMVEDLALALSEAVSNCVEHAFTTEYAGTICVDAATVTDENNHSARVVLTVTDNGRWRPPPAEPGYRGRGLSMIAALVDDLHIDHSPTGTRLRMTSHPSPTSTTSAVRPLATG